jgi:hypothetical protein
MRALPTLRFTILFACTLMFSAARADDAKPARAAPTPSDPTPTKQPASIDAYHALLTQIVKGRFVDYDAAERGRAAITAFKADVARAHVDGLSKDARLAFYTNAYNAIVLDEVLEQKRPASVLKVDGFFDMKMHTVAGVGLTLYALEG